MGRDGDTPYMVMKLLSGQTLRQRIKQGPISPEQALELLLPAIEGVTAAHAAGVVHRDLKPDNIVLHEQGGAPSPKILDFGISKLLGSEQREKLTKTGVSLGTPLYMAPEQMRGDRDVDGRVDVYSLGVMLYQMLTGALPYYGKTYADLVIAVMTGGATRVRERNPAVAPALESAVMKAIATDRGQRQATVSELLAELRAVQGSAETTDTARTLNLPMRDTSTPFTVEARNSWSGTSGSGRKRVLVAGAGVLLVAAAMGALWPRAEAPDADGAPHVVTAAAQPPAVALPLAAGPQPEAAPPAPAGAPLAASAATANKAADAGVAQHPAANPAATPTADPAAAAEAPALPRARAPRQPSTRPRETAGSRRASSELLDPFQ